MIRLLLDTHVWLWAAATPERLGRQTRALLTDLGNERWVSPISTLEIAQLLHRDRIQLPMNLTAWVDASYRELRLETAALSHPAMVEAYALPGDLHRDPADRLLVATARLSGATLLTADDRLLVYPHVATHDART